MVMDGPSLEVFRARLDKALGSLIWWEAPLSRAGNWDLVICKAFSNLSRSMIPLRYDSMTWWFYDDFLICWFSASIIEWFNDDSDSKFSDSLILCFCVLMVWWCCGCSLIFWFHARAHRCTWKQPLTCNPTSPPLHHPDLGTSISASFLWPVGFFP